MKQHENEMDIIYRKYYKDVLYFAKSISGNMDVAEEITQNTFFKAVQSAHKFRGDCDIRVWLCKIAKNDFLNYIRKEKRIVSNDTVEDVLNNLPDNAQPVINQMEDEETAGEIRLILDGMEEPYKEVFTLKVLHEMSYEQIAKLYGKTESWARVTYYRAKMKICNRMEKL